MFCNHNVELIHTTM